MLSTENMKIIVKDCYGIDSNMYQYFDNVTQKQRYDKTAEIFKKIIENYLTKNKKNDKIVLEKRKAR